MDTLTRVISDDLSVRVVAAITTDLTREACRRQDARGLEAIALGRSATCASLLATLAKREHERVIVQFETSGPLGHVVADARGDGRVRAALERHLEAEQPEVEIPEQGGRLSLSKAIGNGHLVVTRDLGMRHRYQGAVDVQSGEIDEDLQHYLDTSEQLPSALRVEVILDGEGRVIRAGGILAQTFPGAVPEIIDQVRQRLAGGSLRQLLSQERSPSQLAGFALGGEAFDDMGTTTLRFECPCEEGSATRILSMLGAEDLDALAGEQEQTEVRCHFCGTRYEFDREAVRKVAAELRARQS